MLNMVADKIIGLERRRIICMLLLLDYYRKLLVYWVHVAEMNASIIVAFHEYLD